jgi:hypothetical protein
MVNDVSEGIGMEPWRGENVGASLTLEKES